MWILVIILVATIIAGIVYAAKKITLAGRDPVTACTASRPRVDALETLLWLSVVLMFIGTIVFVSLGGVSIGTAIKLEVFYDGNNLVYSDATGAIREGVNVQVGDAVLFDAASLMQVEGYAKAVTDQRDSVVRYNSDLKAHRFWQDNWAFGFMFRNVPDRLDYLTLDVPTTP